MSTRWIVVQYDGNTLRLPAFNWIEADKPFDSSVVEREIGRIVVNPFSSSPQTFVPESEKSDAYNDMRVATLEADKLRAENARLRKLVRNLYAEWRFAHTRMRYIVLQHEERMREIEQCMHELGVEVGQ